MAVRRGGGKAGGDGQHSGPAGRGGRGPGQAAPTTTRRTSRTAPEDDAEEQPAGSPPRIASSFTSRALILLLVMAVLGVSYASSIRAWLNQRSEESALSAQIAQEKEQIAQLQTVKQRWDDPAFIEAQARLRFGWVMPGERSYRVIGKDGKVLSAGQSELATPHPDAQASAPPWWQGAVDSLSVAGAPPVVKQQKAQPTHHPATLIGPSGRTGQ